MKGYIPTGGASFSLNDIGSGAIGSGDLGAAVVFSGNVASGQIGGMHLASGAVQSGHIGNQAVNSGNIGSGSIGSVHIQDGTIITVDIASGAVSSGQVASGAVQGFLGATRNIASGTIGQFDFGSGAVIAGTIGSGAVQSGNIASGQVGFGHLANASVQSGTIASGQVSQFHLASGAVSSLASGTFANSTVIYGTAAETINSGELVAVDDDGPATFNALYFRAQASYSTLDRANAVGVALHAATGSGGVIQVMLAGDTPVPDAEWDSTPATSDVGRSVYVSPTTAGNWTMTPSLPFLEMGTVSRAGAGTVKVAVHRGIILRSGQVDAGTLISGLVSQFHLTSGAVNSGHIASGAVIGQAGLGAFTIASGTIGANDIGSGAIISGRIASGQVGFGHLANASVQSGTIASGQVFDVHFASGARIDSAEWTLDNNFITAEIISGSVAKAVAFNQSGALVTAMAAVSGRMPAIGIVTSNYLSGITAEVYRHGRLFTTAASFSGFMNRPLYVGASGHVVASGAPTASGDIQQILGVSISISGMMLQLGDALESAVASSGDVGSGAVTGQAGGGFFVIASGTIGTNDIGSGAIISGNIASGQVGFGHLANASIQSGTLASGIVSRFHLASGAVNSGHVGSGAVLGQAGAGAFTIASGTIGTNDIGSGAIISGRIASGQVGFGHLANASVQSGTLASGVVSRFHLASGAVNSGHVGSGAVLGQAGAGAFTIASGTIATNDIGSGAIQSGNVASGQIGFGHLANASVQSGTVASGTLVSYARQSVEEFNTVEAISGLKVVNLTSGGVVALAMAGSGLRLPAIGVVPLNYVSGALAVVVTNGKIITTSGLDATWSGFAGTLLYTGSGGIIVTQSGLLSGAAWQKIGIAVSGGILVNIDLTLLSGAYTTPAGAF